MNNNKKTKAGWAFGALLILALIGIALSETKKLQTKSTGGFTSPKY